MKSNLSVFVSLLLLTLAAPVMAGDCIEMLDQYDVDIEGAQTETPALQNKAVQLRAAAAAACKAGDEDKTEELLEEAMALFTYPE